MRASLFGAPTLVLASLAMGCGDPPAGLDAAASPDAAEPAPDAAVPIDAFEPPPPEVTIDGLGTVRGIYESGARSFYAIRYAEPPVGALRWQSPVASGAWEGTLDGSSKPDACAQSALSFGSLGSEDCLFLNVHTPNPAPTNAPVIVWIHGGAFVFGEGVQTDRGTRGDLLAAEGAVVVSMNYRLGAFGFFVNDALETSGNAGFEDQILALEWVRDHIADFGGDPSNVTIVGESAGGLSVCLHLVAPRSRGLFQRAISESGLCDSTLSPREERLEVSNDLVAALGCDTASDEGACLRDASLDAVRDASGLDGVFGTLTARVRPWWPYADGTVIPEQFRAAVENDRAAEVPMIVGWNRDEGTLFVDLAERSGVTADETTYHSLAASLGASVGAEASVVEAQYPLADYDDAGAAIGAMLGHAALACPSRRAALLLAEQGYDVHVYRFEFPDAPFQLVERPERELGAFHSAEIQFVFAHSARLGRPRFMEDEAALSAAMQGAWLRFVRTGDPSDASLTWPTFSAASDTHVIFDRTVTTGTAADREACMLWDPAR
ncbi:MAG: carboxylesterase family protein [Deltaproteobacteria bacterium]|nr:carboxylesterase family protein [Deltaproteobacteria bacterium]